MTVPTVRGPAGGREKRAALSSHTQPDPTPVLGLLPAQLSLHGEAWAHRVGESGPVLKANGNRSLIGTTETAV